jgi:hypothetical protein
MMLSAGLLLTVGFGMAMTPLGFSLFYPALPALTASADAAAEQIWIGVAFMRLFGVALASLGLVAWAVRGVGNPDAQNAIARGFQYGAVVAFFVALAQEVAVLHNVAGGLLTTTFLALVVCVVYWRVEHAKADPYGAISVRV